MEGVEDETLATKEKPPVPDRIFDAYLKANMNFPQVDFGIQISVLYTLLDDPDLDHQAFEDFRSCELSEDQLAKVTQTMTRGHRAYGVGDVSERHPESGNPSIHDNRIQRLWLSFRDSVDDAAHLTKPVIGVREDRRETQARLIEDVGKRRGIPAMIADLHDLLWSDEVKDLAKSYREKIDTRSPSLIQIQLNLMDMLNTRHKDEPLKSSLVMALFANRQVPVAV